MKLRNCFPQNFGKKMAGKTGTSQVRKIIPRGKREKEEFKNEDLSYKLRDHSLLHVTLPLISLNLQ